MEYSKPHGNTRAAGMALKPTQFYYLEASFRQRLDEIVRAVLNRTSTVALWEALCGVLPLERNRPESLSRRVEGLEYASDKLWTQAVEGGKRAFGQNFDRGALRQAAGILPISHYHYLSGSREPWGLVRTRRDALNDPQTALLKLRRDVESLAQFILLLPG